MGGKSNHAMKGIDSLHIYDNKKIVSNYFLVVSRRS